MAEKKYLNYEGLQDVASHVNTRLKTVTTIPVSADDGAVRLYIGETTATYTKGHIYQYDVANSEWIDISDDGGGAVDSVNGKTGVVVLNAKDIGLQYDTMPTASVTYENQIVQYTGTTDANYTNGYFYKCVEDSGIYSWVLVADFALASDVYTKTQVGALTDLPDTSKNIVQNIDAINTAVGNKTDKVSSATNGDLAGLNSNGNLTDSGILATDVVTKQSTFGVLMNNGSVRRLANTPTKNSDSVLVSGGMFEELTYLIDAIGRMGAINYLDANPTSATVSGVTFTVNTDKSIEVNGTATADIDFEVASMAKLQEALSKDSDSALWGVGKWLRGCPANGSSNTYCLYYDDNHGNREEDIGDGNQLGAHPATTTPLYLHIGNGTTVNNLIFYPMILDVAVEDYLREYFPYAKNNRDLTTDVASISTTLNNKVDKVNQATADDFATLNASGNLVDSGINKNIIPSNASSSNKLATVNDIPDEISDLNDVEVTNPVNAQILAYNSTSGKWENQTGQAAIGGAVFKGSINFANLPTTGMINGDWYDIKDAFTTDSRFEEGAGIECTAGTDIIWVADDGKWNILTPSGVNSFNGRVGAVVPASGDYDASDIDYDNTTSGLIATDTQDAIDEINTSVNNKADLIDLASAFSTNAPYGKGDYVIYNGDLYRFITNHSAGAWVGTEAKKITVSEDLTDKQNKTVFDSSDFTTLPIVNIDNRLDNYRVSLNKATSVSPYIDTVVTSDAIYTALTDKVSLTQIAPKFSTSVSYKKGDYVYNNQSLLGGEYSLYRFKVDHPAGAWSVSDVEEITIEDALNEKVSWEDNTFLGAKNLIPFPFSQGSLTQNGVTFTVNADGTVSTSGTCNNSNGSSLFLWQNEIPTWMDSNVDYVLTGCPSGGSTSTYTIQYSNWTEGTSTVYYDEGSGVDIRKITDSTTQRLRIWIRNGVNADGLVFKPMIRLKSDTDNTYAKYSKTNVALTKDKVEWSANLLTGVHNIDASQYFEGVSNDVTWSYIDGVLDANGTATANSQKGTPFIAPYSAQVIVSGCNSGNANIHIYPFDITDNNRPYRDSTKNSRLTTNDNVYNGNEISFYMEQGHEYQITCRVVNGNTANHVKFYPLLRLASDPDITYTPYAMTNAELTKKTIFVATYGSTTYAEINKAFNDGKYIVVKREIADTSHFIYYLRSRDTSGTYYFQTFGNSNTTNYYCSINSSTWAVGSVYLASLASPAFTGTPTAPTATAGTNTTQIATTAFVQSALPDVTGKADKVTNATNGNFAGLDASGNLTDSGKSSSSFLPNNYLEQTVTTTANTDTTVTFTNNTITSDKVIEVFAGRSGGDVSGSQNVFPYKDIYVDGTNHTCTITYPALDTAISMKVRIYIY